MLNLWLYLHILGAIVAFGFGFYAPIYGRATAKEPQHANWYLRTSKQVSNLILIPVALSMAVTGSLMVAEHGGVEYFQQLWLALGVTLYVIALIVVFAFQRPAFGKLIALTSQPPGPDGPSPEVPELVRRLQLYGFILLGLVLVIVALMVTKPGA